MNLPYSHDRAMSLTSLLVALERAADTPTPKARRYSRGLEIKTYRELLDIRPSNSAAYSATTAHHRLPDEPWSKLGDFELCGNASSDWMMLLLSLMPTLTRLTLRSYDG
jgi:hypothetical protein